MIVGLGTDIVEIQRIQDAVERWGDHFLHRVFTAEERSYCMAGKKNPYPHLAARFAAKESAVKALTPLRGPGEGAPNLTDIEIFNDADGKPHMRLHGPAQAVLKNHTIHVSLSHEKRYAVATVVLARTDTQAV
ncbi:MAG: holo-acyl-carrier protein synthase [Nitrospirae bacterium]|nr:MAG: holo-acyl-carrier protein synthase [Nitrospirota bacterium]